MHSLLHILISFWVGFPSNKQREKILHHYWAGEFTCKQVLAKIDQKASKAGRAG